MKRLSSVLCGSASPFLALCRYEVANHLERSSTSLALAERIPPSLSTSRLLINRRKYEVLDYIAAK